MSVINILEKFNKIDFSDKVEKQNACLNYNIDKEDYAFFVNLQNQYYTLLDLREGYLQKLTKAIAELEGEENFSSYINGDSNSNLLMSVNFSNYELVNKNVKFTNLAFCYRILEYLRKKYEIADNKKVYFEKKNIEKFESDRITWIEIVELIQLQTGFVAFGNLK